MCVCARRSDGVALVVPAVRAGELAGAERGGEARAAAGRVECAEAARARRVERHERDARGQRDARLARAAY